MAPVVSFVATALTPMLGAQAAAIVAGALVQIGGSILVNAVARRFAPKPSSPDLIRELQRDQELPPYRFAYGETRVWGSWAPRRVKGKEINGCLILNSRPSHAITKIWLDGREVVLNPAHDPYNFAGPGALATNGVFDNHFRCWFGLGGQTTAPQYIVDRDNRFSATDAWRGRTVMWVRIDAGDSEDRLERWPSSPPVVSTDGRWSKVWDPRDTAQDPDDPATHVWSRNWALIVLDALMRNPIQQYRIGNTLLQSFIEAANSADEVMAKKDGTSEPRYCADGALVFEGSELLDQLGPLLEAGAGSWTRVGGRLGLVPGVWRDPTVTVTDALDPEMEFDRWIEGRELINVVKARYVSPARGYEMADLPPYSPPGAVAADGAVERTMSLDLNFVKSATQAMRLQAIAGKKARLQKRWAGVLPPESLDVVAGARVDLAFPAPFGRYNTSYEVDSTHPAMDLIGDSGVALRQPVRLRELLASVFAWDPQTEEVEVLDPPPVGRPGKAMPPAYVTLVTGATAAINVGDTTVARVIATIGQSASGHDYAQVEYTTNGTNWISLGDARLTNGPATVIISPVAVGTTYTVRARSRVQSSMWQQGYSDWTVSGTIVAAGPSVTLTAPITGTATGASGAIDVTFVAPNDEAFQSIQLYVSTTGNSGDATAYGSRKYGNPGQTFAWTVTGVPSGQARWMWARAFGAYSSQSGLSSSLTATAL